MRTQKNPLPHAAKRARELRKTLTPAETALWEALRNRRFHKLKFRRQAPIGRFVADFLCVDPPLIIELDGIVHDFQKTEDQSRTDVIKSDYGIPVLRFSNDEVLTEMLSVLKKIEAHLMLS